METAGILQSLQENSKSENPPIQFLSLRAISDTLHEDIDFDFNQFYSFQGKLKPLGALRYFLKNPHAAWGLRRLVRNSQKAALELSETLYASLMKKEELGL
jgi:hypothetical protein